MKYTSVNRMIDLITRKNKYLSDFKELNKEELGRIESGNLNNLEAFYFDREILLNAIDRIDKQLVNYKMDQLEDVCENTKKQILGSLTEKRKLINQILNQDLSIHSCLQQKFNHNEEEQSA